MVKRLLLLGFALALLVGIPLAVFVAQNQTQPQSKAASATIFSFGNVPSTAVTVGTPFNVQIVVDPQGTNQVSFVKVAFTYDGSKLSTSANGIAIDPKYNPPLENPQVNCTDAQVCTGTFTISVGQNPSNIIKSSTPIATVTFNPTANTGGQTTLLSYVPNQNQALSVASADQPAENVYQSGTPASITIVDTGGGGGTDTTGGGTGGSGTGTGGGGGGTGGSGTGTSGDGGGISSAVTCSSLTADPTSGTPPLNVTFTVVGNSANDAISKISLNYGDGLVDELASGSGIGTGNINAQLTHQYPNNGTFTATASLTTSLGSVSTPTDCAQTITVGTGVGPTGTKKGIPPTGPGQTILLIGAGGVVITAVGILLIAGL